MTNNDLDRAWNSPENNPSEQAPLLAQQFLRGCQRRRQLERLWLIWTFVTLATISGFAAWLIVATDRIQLEREWALLLLLIIPWGFAGYFLRGFFKSPPSSKELSIKESFEASLVSNQAARKRLKTIGLLYLIMIPVLTISIQQLAITNKTRPHEQDSLIMFLAAVLLVSGGTMAVRYFRYLRPQGRKLEKLLREYTHS